MNHSRSRAPHLFASVALALSLVAAAPSAEALRDQANHSSLIQPSRRNIRDAFRSRYVVPEGHLFVNGVKLSDVRQGGVGDCYFLAALAAVAHQQPDVIKQAFEHHTDGMLTVHLFRRVKGEDGKTSLEPTQVQVDRRVPLSKKTRLPLYAKSSPRRAKGEPAEQWVMMMEKAFAKDNDGYGPIEGGNAGQALEVITGQKSRYIKTDPKGTDQLFDDLRQASRERRPMVTVGSFDNDSIGERLKESTPEVQNFIQEVMNGKPYGERKPLNRFQRVIDKLGWFDIRGKELVRTGMVSHHAYTVLGVIEKDGQRFVTIRNPWGSFTPGKGGLGVDIEEKGDGIFDLPIDLFATLFPKVAIGGTMPSPQSN